MDKLKAARRILDQSQADWRNALWAIAYALVVIAENLQYDDKGLAGELDRMRSRLTQAHVEIGKLKAERTERDNQETYQEQSKGDA